MEPQLQQQQQQQPPTQLPQQPAAITSNFNVDEDRRSFNTSPLPLDENKMPKKWIPRNYDRWVWKFAIFFFEFDFNIESPDCFSFTG